MKIVYDDSINVVLEERFRCRGQDKIKAVYVSDTYVGIAYRISWKKPHCDTRYSWAFVELDDFCRDKITLQNGDPEGYVTGTLGELKKQIRAYYKWR